MSLHHAVDHQRAILTLDDVRFFAFHIRQVTGDRFAQVGLRDDPFIGRPMDPTLVRDVTLLKAGRGCCGTSDTDTCYGEISEFASAEQA